MPREQDRHSKIGAGHLEAMGRKGWKEIGALGTFEGSNVTQPMEYGQFGSLTPGEVAESRRPEEKDLDEEPTILGSRMQEAERLQAGRGKDNKELERE